MTKPRMEAADLNDDDHGIVVKENGASSTVTVENIKTLQCGVCKRPLKPPIFQCLKGRVALCSHCCDLPLLIDDVDDDRRCLACHVSGVVVHGGGHYISCPAMDRLVESVRVPCPHAAHGCAARMPFYDQRGHGEACRYAPRGCPVKACGFAGPAWALLEHLSGEHLGVEAVQRFWAEELGAAMAKLKASVEADEMSEAGMKPSDIELVMAQASVPRSAAVRALKEKAGDIVNAIMGLVDGDIPI